MQIYFEKSQEFISENVNKIQNLTKMDDGDQASQLRGIIFIVVSVIFLSLLFCCLQICENSKEDKPEPVCVKCERKMSKNYGTMDHQLCPALEDWTDWYESDEP